MEGIEPKTTENSNKKGMGSKDSRILSLFDTCKKNTFKAPKKEYVRCKLIRGHKRAIRQVLSNITPKTTIHKFDEGDLKASSQWNVLKLLTTKDSASFMSLCKTEAGPVTDGKAKRLSDSFQDCEKSFNGKFCKQYFAQEDVRESFCQYINLIFTDYDPAILCEKFEFYCCRGSKHQIECLDKWVNLSLYLKGDMLRELDCEPVTIQNNYVRLPDFSNFLDFEAEDVSLVNA